MNKIGEKFMEKTKYQYLGESDQKQGLPQPPLELDVPADAEFIPLPAVENIVIPAMDLRKSIESRTSVRKYADQPLSLEELAYLLWCTQGVKKIVPGKATFRNVPSAGARNPFETYLLINNVSELKPGLYRYLALEHKLMVVDLEPEIIGKIVAGSGNGLFVRESAVTFIWNAVVARTKWRYDERSYRYIHLDAGHVCQNLYLAAESINSGVCAIAAFDDDEMNTVLKLDGVEQFVIYMATVGKKEVK